MYGIAELKKMVIDCLMKKELETMSMEQLDQFIMLIGKTAVIQERDLMDNYLEIMKELRPEKRNVMAPVALGLGTLGNS